MIQRAEQSLQEDLGARPSHFFADDMTANMQLCEDAFRHCGQCYQLCMVLQIGQLGPALVKRSEKEEAVFHDKEKFLKKRETWERLAFEFEQISLQYTMSLESTTRTRVFGKSSARLCVTMMSCFRRGVLQGKWGWANWSKKGTNISERGRSAGQT